MVMFDNHWRGRLCRGDTSFSNGNPSKQIDFVLDCVLRVTAGTTIPWRYLCPCFCFLVYEAVVNISCDSLLNVLMRRTQNLAGYKGSSPVSVRFFSSFFFFVLFCYPLTSLFKVPLRPAKGLFPFQSVKKRKKLLTKYLPFPVWPTKLPFFRG